MTPLLVINSIEQGFTLAMGFCGKFVEAITRRKSVVLNQRNSNLVRCLSTADLSFVGIGCMLGSGVYILPGEVAGEMAGPAAILSFAIAGKQKQ